MYVWRFMAGSRVQIFCTAVVLGTAIFSAQHFLNDSSGFERFNTAQLQDEAAGGSRPDLERSFEDGGE